MDSASAFDWSAWKAVIVPTIYVHLLGVDRRECERGYVSSLDAMHYCNVCFPLATCLSSRACDPNELIEALAKEVERRYLQTARASSFLAEGASITLRTGHHKKNEVEIGAARFVVSACASDRPAAILKFVPGPESSIKKVRELFHWYCAQGLDRQHHLQQAVLARVRDIRVAVIIVQVLQERLCIPHASVRAICKDETDRHVLLHAWSKDWTGGDLVAMPGFSLEAREVAPLSVSWQHFYHCFPFIHAVDPLAKNYADSNAHLADWQALFQAEQLVRFTSAAWICAAPEPSVNYVHEEFRCRVPPGTISIPLRFRGELLYGGLSPVLDLQWLRWICCAPRAR